MADGFIQVAPDSTGKKMETSELTRTDGTVVERERVAIGDPVNVANMAEVSPRGLQIDVQFQDMFQAILIELRVISSLLVEGLNMRDANLDLRRDDVTQLNTIQQQ